jgi:hypothetical protein
MAFTKMVAQGITISFILHIIFATLVVYMGSKVSLENFTVILFLLMIAVSLWAGRKGGKLGAVIGSIVGLGTSGIILIYLNQRIEMDWVVNRYIIGAYVITGFAFSMIGSIFISKKKKEKIGISPLDRENKKINEKNSYLKK